LNESYIYEQSRFRYETPIDEKQLLAMVELKDLIKVPAGVRREERRSEWTVYLTELYNYVYADFFHIAQLNETKQQILFDYISVVERFATPLLTNIPFVNILFTNIIVLFAELLTQSDFSNDGDKMMRNLKTIKEALFTDWNKFKIENEKILEDIQNYERLRDPTVLTKLKEKLAELPVPQFSLKTQRLLTKVADVNNQNLNRGDEAEQLQKLALTLTDYVEADLAKSINWIRQTRQELSKKKLVNDELNTSLKQLIRNFVPGGQPVWPQWKQKIQDIFDKNGVRMDSLDEIEAADRELTNPFGFDDLISNDPNELITDVHELSYGSTNSYESGGDEMKQASGQDSNARTYDQIDLTDELDEPTPNRQQDSLRQQPRLDWMPRVQADPVPVSREIQETLARMRSAQSNDPAAHLFQGANREGQRKPDVPTNPRKSNVIGFKTLAKRNKQKKAAEGKAKAERAAQRDRRREEREDQTP